MQPVPHLKAAKATHGFHATFKARPGCGDRALEILMTAPARSHADCVVFLVGRSASDRDVIYVTEGWTSREAHARFFHSHEGQICVASLGPLIEGEPQYLDEVPVGGKAAFCPRAKLRRRRGASTGVGRQTHSIQSRETL